MLSPQPPMLKTGTAFVDYISWLNMAVVMSSTLPVPLTLRYAGALTLALVSALFAQLE